MRSQLRAVNAGYAKLSGLFDAGVQARALRYVHHSVELVCDSEQLLTARVRGTHLYRAAFARSGDTLSFGCSCPYFLAANDACKHLWAVVVHATASQLVERAATAKRFTPTLLPWVTDGRLHQPDDDFDDDEDLDDDDDDAFDDEPDEPASSALSRTLQAQLDRYATKHVAPRGWRSLDIVRPAPQPAQIELVYLLAPSMEWLERGTASIEVLIGQRRVPEPEQSSDTVRALTPALSLDPRALAHPVDRQLYAMLQGVRLAQVVEGASIYGSNRGYRHVVALSGWALRPALELIADTGRGHLAPPRLALDKYESWHEFKLGSKTRGRGRAATPIDYSAFLAWPVLERDAGEPWELELRLESRPTRRARADAYSVSPRLVRGEESTAPERVSLADVSGAAIVDNRLTVLEPLDARWLSNLQRTPDLVVPAPEVPEFASLAVGKAGVSRFALPSGYDVEEPSEPPLKRLDLLTPSARTTDGEVYFEYGSVRVRAQEPSRFVFLSEQRVLARDLDFEERALDELWSAGLAAVASQPHVRIQNDSLVPTVHALLEQGWQVYGEGRRYRSLASFDIEFESGVDWFGLTGQARFGDGANVPFPRLLRALKQQRHVVELGDGSRGLLPDDWAARFGLLAELSSDKKDQLRFSARQLGLVELLCAAAPEASGLEALQSLRQTLDRFQHVEPRRAPADFRGELRQYQEAGLGWLHAVTDLGFGACLADDMGLGKTIQVLAHLYELHRAQPAASSPRRSLVVVPRSLLGNWLAEAQRFAPDLRVHIHWGKERGKPGTRWGEGDEAAELILTTYGALRLDIAELAKHTFEAIVLDESQAIKNEKSATARAAKLLRGRRRIAMSGTPVENHVGELWSLFEFLNPGLLGELPGLGNALGRARPSEHACHLIRRAVRPFILRRTKREVAKDLPDRIEQTLYVDLEKDEREYYDELARHYRASIGKKLRELGPERSTPHVLEALLRLRQAACHPGLIDRSRDHESSAKVDLLLEQLRSVRAEGHKALVFSQFTSLLAIVRSRLEQERVPFEYLDGKTTDRAERVSRFQTDDSLSVFLISLKAGGVGLNLTAADYVFILDPWWNPAVEAQAIDRAHRIGQQRTVIAYRLLARHTVEERVAELQSQKRDLVESLMGDSALSAKLTRSDLEALLDLGER
ncbi:MAG: DEAD/DEAH box helicase [Myxococcota bacterium]|jgi:SNF2-related domain/Helicase conserved C-terminal domain|nr:DEAD/DEAH box helicase [Myxococcota bacterium]